MKIPPQFIVVDDDPINNLVCKYNIAGFAPAARIQLFTDPENALAWIREEYIQKADTLDSVLFLDINMPVMNGWEFLEEFSSLPKTVHERISIFILSSSIDPDDKQNAENHPLVHGYYSKPLNRDTIKQIYKEE
jgi:CheY-like chemotaxis protein